MREYLRSLRVRTSMLLDSLAEVLGGFFDEAQFRILLALAVLTGRMPRPVDKRMWLRSVEVPVLIECRDWVNNKRLFPVMVWPPLEVPKEQAERVYDERIESVKRILCTGAGKEAWSIRLSTDWGLVWDHSRECWKDSSGFYYDGRRANPAA